MLFSTYVRLCVAMCIYGCGDVIFFFLALRFEYSISDMLPPKKKKDYYSHPTETNKKKKISLLLK